MKSFFIFIFLMVNVTNMIGQNADSIIVSSGSPSIIYPLINDKNIEKRQKAGIDCHYIHPLLILNNLIIREEENVNCFRNRFEFANLKSIKLISKVDAEKKNIPNVPKDGVLFVTTKEDYYFDFSCK
ncbi:hypothetical protein [Proteiniphilum sp. X52]|uniref:hypothetical protein n=1 Tax=Proteiniphilum sp. X52 TaxID=2382159 RepID=UPI002100FC57|nr:hypothetical protein [Proteiniphilum sp. X52]